jgi:hypothetical protein
MTMLTWILIAGYLLSLLAVTGLASVRGEYWVKWIGLALLASPLLAAAALLAAPLFRGRSRSKADRRRHVVYEKPYFDSYYRGGDK